MNNAAVRLVEITAEMMPLRTAPFVKPWMTPIRPAVRLFTALKEMTPAVPALDAVATELVMLYVFPVVTRAPPFVTNCHTLPVSAAVVKVLPVPFQLAVNEVVELEAT